jgi:hypothetical protein
MGYAQALQMEKRPPEGGRYESIRPGVIGE